MWTGGLKSSGDSSEDAVMSGVSAASKLSAAMQSMNPSTQSPNTQSQHHVEQYRQQHQSADGSSTSMAAARYVVSRTAAVALGYVAPSIN